MSRGDSFDCVPFSFFDSHDAVAHRICNIKQLYFMKESVKVKVTKTRKFSERVSDNVVVFAFRREKGPAHYNMRGL
jgi:hypothetical protein